MGVNAHMRYVLDGCSRFTGSHLQLELDAPSAEEAIARATRLGLVQVVATPALDRTSNGSPHPGGARANGEDDDAAAHDS